MARVVAEAKATLLYGAGWAGVILARSAARGDSAADVIPVGFLDDDPDLAGTARLGPPGLRRARMPSPRRSGIHGADVAAHHDAERPG